VTRSLITENVTHMHTFRHLFSSFSESDPVQAYTSIFDRE